MRSELHRKSVSGETIRFYWDSIVVVVCSSLHTGFGSLARTAYGGSFNLKCLAGRIIYSSSKVKQLIRHLLDSFKYISIQLACICCTVSSTSSFSQRAFAGQFTSAFSQHAFARQMKYINIQLACICWTVSSTSAFTQHAFAGQFLSLIHI